MLLSGARSTLLPRFVAVRDGTLLSSVSGLQRVRSSLPLHGSRFSLAGCYCWPSRAVALASRPRPASLFCNRLLYLPVRPAKFLPAVRVVAGEASRYLVYSTAVFLDRLGGALFSLNNVSLYLLGSFAAGGAIGISMPYQEAAWRLCWVVFFVGCFLFC